MTAAAVRRLIHVGSAAVLLVALYHSWSLLRWMLSVGVAALIALDLCRVRVPEVGAALGRLVPLFRLEEQRRLSGATWLWLGYALAAWTPPEAATAGILVAAISDPAASLVGTWVDGRRRKSLPGSLAALVTSALVLALLGLPGPAVVGGAALGAVLERWSGPLNDNLVMAPGVAVFVWSFG